MKILFNILLFLISVFSARAQVISVSFSCVDEDIIVNLTSPGGNVSSNVVWYLISDSNDPTTTETNAQLITNCYVSAHYYLDGSGWEVECCEENPYGGGGAGEPSEERMAATSEVLPSCVAHYSDQTVVYWFNTNPLSFTMGSGTYKIKCILNGNSYYTDYFYVPSYLNPDKELCGSYSAKSNYHTFNKITTCSTGVSLNSSGNPNDVNNGNLYLKAGDYILLSPGFSAPFASNLVAVIGDVCDGSNFRIGNLRDNNVSETVSTFSVYPNPSIGTISITIPEEGSYNVYVDDLYGQIVYENKFESNAKEVDLKGLKPGIYYLRVKANNQTYNSKIVIE